MEKRYDGSLFPISVRIVNKEEPEREQWLELPTTPQTLRELLQNISGDRQGWYLGEVDCHLYNAAAVENCTDIDELNYLAAALEALTDGEFGSYQAIVDTGRHCDTIQDFINLTENLDCYDIAPNIQDYEDLAQYVLHERDTYDYSTLRALEDYIDYEAFGRDVAVSEGGSIEDDCYISPTSSPFAEFYDGNPETIPAGYVVFTPELLLLTAEEKKDWAEDLAVQCDSFFRDFDSGYTEKYPEKRSQVAAFYDWLIDGKIAFLESRLKDLGQTEQDALYSDLQDYKKLTAYDPALDDLPNTIQVLVVEPRKAPCLREVEESDFHSILGGDYSVTHPFGPEVAVLCQEDGRESGLEWNRALYNGRGQVYDVIAGTFLVAGIDGDKIASLPDDLANKYNRRFQTIEVYAQVGERTVMFQVPQDNLSDLSDRDLDSILRAKLENAPLSGTG